MSFSVIFCHCLGFLLNIGSTIAATLYESKMYQRALQGYEKAWGPEHTSTLNTVNNLGSLYKKLDGLNEAEKMYQRALRGYEKHLGYEHKQCCSIRQALATMRENVSAE
jgi:tetratricopeptide (TPR) repeat protein